MSGWARRIELGAVPGLRRAIELNPRYIVARYWYAALKATRLQLDEAIAENERALAIEPLPTFANAQLGIALLIAGRTTRAIAQLRTAIDLDPHFAMAHWALWGAHATESHSQHALSQLPAAVELSHRLPSMVASLAACYAEAGRAGAGPAAPREAPLR